MSVPAISRRNNRRCFYLSSLPTTVYKKYRKLLRRNLDKFSICYLHSLSLHADTNNAGLIHALPTSSVSKVHKTHSTGLEPRTFFGFVTLFPSRPRRNKRLRSWRLSSTVLSFRATESISTGALTPTLFRGCGLCLWNIIFETTLVLVPCFYRAWFLSYINRPHPV